MSYYPAIFKETLDNSYIFRKKAKEKDMSNVCQNECFDLYCHPEQFKRKMYDLAVAYFTPFPFILKS